MASILPVRLLEGASLAETSPADERAAIRRRWRSSPALVAGALALPWATGRVASQLLVGAYAVANLAAAAFGPPADFGRRVCGIAVAFAILHLSYGSGFLVGLLKFWNRWGEGDATASRFDRPACIEPEPTRES